MSADTFLQSTRDNGNWIPCPAELIKVVLDTYYDTRPEGSVTPDHIASLELLYWSDLDNIKPLNYYVKRWGWGRKRTYNYLCKRGLMGVESGEREGNDRGTEGERKGNDLPASVQEIATQGNARGTPGEREGNDRGTVYPDSYSEPDSEKKGEAPAVFSSGGIPPTNPTGATPNGGVVTPTASRPVDEDDAIGYGALIGLGRESAKKFFWHYSGKGWEGVRDWKAMMKAWQISDQTRATSTTNAPRFTSGGGFI